MKKWLPMAMFGLLNLGLALMYPTVYSVQSIDAMLTWLPLVLVVTLGQVIVILTGRIDISVGSIVGLSAMILGTIVAKNQAIPVWQQGLVAMVTGAFLGTVNWLLIAFGKLQPLVATIATMAAYRGLAFLANGGSTVTASQLPNSMLDLARSGIKMGGLTLSWLMVVAVVVALLVAFVLRWTRTGRELLQFGSQEQAAVRRGISEKRVILVSFATSGLLAGLGGLFFAAKFGSINPGTAGLGLELTVIAAAVIGGTKLTGGIAPIGKVGISCLFLAFLNVGLSVVGLGADWQMFVYGLVLLVALAFDRNWQRGAS